MTRILPALAIGVTAGFVGGLFGVGGGVIVVPGLIILLKFTQYDASGTSVATIVASSAAAVAVLAGDGSVDWPAAAVLFVGAGTGAHLATKWIDKVPEYALAGAFTVMLVLGAVRMWP